MSTTQNTKIASPFTMPSSSSSFGSIPPSLAWLTVFLPAFFYFAWSRFESSVWLGRSNYGQAVDESNVLWLLSDTDGCQQASDVFSVVCQQDSNRAFLKKPLYLVQQDGLQDVVSTCWKHDEDLGRGFLLLSQSSHRGRIWRWEVGGGPIAIGRTLFLEHSGCRHESCDTPKQGSGGMAVDFSGKEHASEGRLVLAEYGERRVVRMEENGARTPLMIQIPDPCGVEDTSLLTRVTTPHSLLYTPHGDLLSLNPYPTCNTTGLLRLRQAVHVDPLESLWESRKAHKWTHTKSARTSELVYQADQIGDMALDTTWMGLYLTVLQGQDVLLVRLTLEEEDEDQDDNVAATSSFDLTNYASAPGPVTVTNQGHVLVGIDKGILLLKNGGKEPLARLSCPASPTSFTLGEDGFLYVSTLDSLFRVQVQQEPLKIPTDLLAKKK